MACKDFLLFCFFVLFPSIRMAVLVGTGGPAPCRTGAPRPMSLAAMRLAFLCCFPYLCANPFGWVSSSLSPLAGVVSSPRVGDCPLKMSLAAMRLAFLCCFPYLCANPFGWVSSSLSPLAGVVSSPRVGDCPLNPLKCKKYGKDINPHQTRQGRFGSP